MFGFVTPGILYHPTPRTVLVAGDKIPNHRANGKAGFIFEFGIFLGRRETTRSGWPATAARRLKRYGRAGRAEEFGKAGYFRRQNRSVDPSASPYHLSEVEGVERSGRAQGLDRRLVDAAPDEDGLSGSGASSPVTEPVDLRRPGLRSAAGEEGIDPRVGVEGLDCRPRVGQGLGGAVEGNEKVRGAIEQLLDQRKIDLWPPVRAGSDEEIRRPAPRLAVG
jgi:hypothetical protein